MATIFMILCLKPQDKNQSFMCTSWTLEALYKIIRILLKIMVLLLNDYIFTVSKGSVNQIHKHIGEHIQNQQI